MITMKFETQLYDFKIRFAYHSGKIENDDIIYHDTREIFEDGRIMGYTGSLKTLFEIENQRRCYDFLKSYILKKQPLDITLIKKVQEKLTREMKKTHSVCGLFLKTNP